MNKDDKNQAPPEDLTFDTPKSSSSNYNEYCYNDNDYSDEYAMPEPLNKKDNNDKKDDKYNK